MINEDAIKAAVLAISDMVVLAECEAEEIARAAVLAYEAAKPCGNTFQWGRHLASVNLVPLNPPMFFTDANGNVHEIKGVE